LHADYCSVGYDPEGFWRITPRELAARLEGARRRFEREQNERSWLAWHIAYLPRTKKPVDLRKMITGKKHQPMRWEEQLAAWEAYAGAQPH
jgi:hypothetical protein